MVIKKWINKQKKVNKRVFYPQYSLGFPLSSTWLSTYWCIITISARRLEPGSGGRSISPPCRSSNSSLTLASFIQSLIHITHGLILIICPTLVPAQARRVLLSLAVVSSPLIYSYLLISIELHTIRTKSWRRIRWKKSIFCYYHLFVCLLLIHITWKKKEEGIIIIVFVISVKWDVTLFYKDWMLL